MSDHAERALQSVSGSFTDPAHRLAAAQVHATLAVAEALEKRPIVIDTLTGLLPAATSLMVDPRIEAWEEFKRTISDGEWGAWDKNELLELMADCLSGAIAEAHK